MDYLNYRRPVGIDGVDDCISHRICCGKLVDKVRKLIFLHCADLILRNHDVILGCKILIVTYTTGIQRVHPGIF